MLRDGHEMKPPSVEPWHDMGFALAFIGAPRLGATARAAGSSRSHGQHRETISDKWLGVLESDHRSAPEQWGLDGGEDDCVLPGSCCCLVSMDKSWSRCMVSRSPGARPGSTVKTALGGITQGCFIRAASLLEVPGTTGSPDSATAGSRSRPRFRLFWPNPNRRFFVRSFLFENPGQPMDLPPGTPWPRPPPFIFCEGGPPRGRRDPLAKRLSGIATLCFERANDLRRPSRGRRALRDRMLKALPLTNVSPNTRSTRELCRAPGEPPDETFMQGFEPPDIKTINDKLQEDLLNHHIAETEALLNGHPQFRETIGRSGGVDLRAMLAEHENLDADETMAMVVCMRAKGLAMLDGAKPGNAETLKPMMEENIARLLAAKSH